MFMIIPSQGESWFGDSWQCWHNNTTEKIEDDFKDRMKKEVIDPENVDDAAINDTEKAVMEILGDAEKTV